MALIGAGIGAAVGGVGNVINSISERSQADRNRRRQRKAIQGARDFAGGTTVVTGGRSAQQGALNPFEPRTSGGVSLDGTGGGPTFVDPVTGQRRSGGRVEEILSSPILSQAMSFLQGTFENAGSSPLAQDFQAGIRQAQSARGTFFGGTAAIQEGSGLAAFSQTLRQQLLPSALQFGTLGEQLRQNITGFESNLRTAAATGGGGVGSFQAPTSSPFGSFLSGALQGATAGGIFGSEFLGSQGANPDDEILNRLLTSSPGAGSTAQRVASGFGGGF